MTVLKMTQQIWLKKAGAVVLSHKSNYGKGKALKTLFDYGKNTKTDVMVTIDGDGQFFTRRNS